jgi:hypothetical protein
LDKINKNYEFLQKFLHITSRTARDEGYSALRARGAPRHRRCLRSTTLFLFLPEKEKKLQKEKKAQGAFYKPPP